jgi:hypothetical protein
VRVDNPPLRLSVTGAVSGGAVEGVLRLAARASDPVERVVLYADGKQVSRDSTAPYSLVWDTTAAAGGGYELVLSARDAHGHPLSRNWVTHHVRVPGADSFGVGFDTLR